MTAMLEEFLSARVEEIIKNLRDENSEYALIQQECCERSDMIEEITNHDGELHLFPLDLTEIQEFFECEYQLDAITQLELYKHGLTDCIQYLKQLHVLPS